MREVQPVADEFPAYEMIRVTRDGHLWVRDYDRPPYDAPHRWVILDPEGRLVGRIETPRNLRIFEIGSDYVLGVDRDELDIERLRLHGLVRGGGS